MANRDYSQPFLNHYHIKTPFPVEWPVEIDSDNEELDNVPPTSRAPDAPPQSPPPQSPPPQSRRKSVYAILERPSYRQQFKKPEIADVIEADDTNPVEARDPLGSQERVLDALRRRGLPVDDDAQLRSNFLLSSRTFSPTLFLSEVHSDASTQSLFQGLEFLSNSIDQKSASLKALVETNFERFVKVKGTIDEVYSEMKSQGVGQEADKTHSRQTSRTSTHFRNTSGSGTIGTGSSPSKKNRKNALRAESQYGVQGIRTPLTEASTRAIEIWGPALGGREREESLRAVLAAVDRHRGLFQVARTIADCIGRKDYEALIEEYGRARRYADEARATADASLKSGVGLKDAEIHHIIVTARMWVEVEEQVDRCRRDLLRRLVEGHAESSAALRESSITGAEEHLELIGLLLELGTSENPIWVWLLSRYQHLRGRISSTCERFRAETEYVRRRLACEERPGSHIVATFLRAAEADHSALEPPAKDRSDVIELWERIYSSLQVLLGARGSVLAEVVDFWETARSFIDGRAQRTLPIGYDGESRKHHRIASESVKDLQRGAVELVGLIRDHVQGFFADPPIDDLSSLATSDPSAAGFASPFRPHDSRIQFDVRSAPPQPPMRGDVWEGYAFWPPHANCLSGAHYLGMMLVLVGSAAGEISGMHTIGQSQSNQERLRHLVSTARERCAQAVAAAWKHDAEDCKALEDWKRVADGKEATEMPAHFMAFESTVMYGMQQILYISDAMSKPGSAEMVPPPSAKMLQLVRSQFVASLHTAFSGMVENAERVVRTCEPTGAAILGSVDIAHPSTDIVASSLTAQSVDGRNPQVRILLTLSNVQLLRSDIVPRLITQFENAFSVKLTEETKTLRDMLAQIDARLFQSYTAPIIEEMRGIVRAGVLAPDWAASQGRPCQVRPYIYKALLCLVMVHAQASTTAPAMTPQILSYLFEQTSNALLQAFRQRSRFTLAALMQATLDVEFVAQTLSQYTTDKASEVQGQIYLEIDQGTDNDARRMLQDELPQMRIILKMLRESSKAEFACFKKARSQRDKERGERAHHG